QAVSPPGRVPGGHAPDRAGLAGARGHAGMSLASAVAVIREGVGPEVLLVHGGASPQTTWGALAPLTARWTLAFVHRRGYPPSPPAPGGGHDFEVDARDLAPLLGARPHVVAHSYGVLGA